MNLRPSGYEPDELPDCSTPRYPNAFMVPGAGIEPARTLVHRILSPVRLPVPPARPAELIICIAIGCVNPDLGPMSDEFEIVLFHGFKRILFAFVDACPE